MSLMRSLTTTFAQSFSRFTESMFPEARSIPQRNEQLMEDTITTGEDTSSSLLLQMLLYFNSCFSVVYCLLSVAITGYKVKWVSALTFEKFIYPIMIAVWTMVEIPRLYIGMKGNLNEQVAKLSAFFFISFIPQTGIAAFLLFGTKYMFPVEHALNIIMLLFLLPEIVLGYIATRRAIRSQTARFFVERWTADVDEEPVDTGDGIEMAPLRQRGTAM